MARIFYYKIVHDNGTAPCVADDLLSLAVGKPAVRKSAQVDDWLVGFAAKSLAPDTHLIYVARVTERLLHGDYFRQPAYQARQDCIYLWRDGAFVLRPSATHHQDPAKYLEHDLGKAPAYAGAVTLLSTEFRYYGSAGSDAWKQAHPALAAAVAKLGQGHRVNHEPSVQRDLEALIAACCR